MLVPGKARHSSPQAGALSALILLGTVALASPVAAQLDVCGCADHPDAARDFDTADENTWPAGTDLLNNVLTLPLPVDGSPLVFRNFSVRGVKHFAASVVTFDTFDTNAANTPVRLLLSGDLTIASASKILVDGNPGVVGSQNGLGGLGGPGAFPGGNGAFQAASGAADGGIGLGPGGGARGTASPLTHGGNATVLPPPDILPPELLPIIGGSGGGGGASSAGGATCHGGGGGGGGGALVIAANGTITVNQSAEITAFGGNGAPSAGLASCSSGGGGGSGGAIRLLAAGITGTGRLWALGGFGFGAVRAGSGAIRLEAFNNGAFDALPVANTNPIASRAPAPGPLVNPVRPTVRITSVAGVGVSATPQGVFGGVDVSIPAPGPVTIALATSGVPSGTAVRISVKPRVGGTPIELAPALDPANCRDGNCSAAVAVTLQAGAYVIEARATFLQP